MGSPSIGVLDSGLHHRTSFAGYKVEFIIPHRDRPLFIEKYDIVIIPFHTDQITLGHCRNDLEQFVNRGGVLIVLGACDYANTNWIPFCSWSSEFTYKTYFQGNEPIAMRIFRSLEDEDVQFHSKYHAHGSLLPRFPKKTQILAKAENNKIVMVHIKGDNEGAAIITTLDPDHHRLSTVAGPKKMTSPQARQKAITLMDNILDWGLETVVNRPNNYVRPNPEIKSFIVHGRDIQLAYELQKIIKDEFGLPQPLILQEQSVQGETIIEKFEKLAKQSQIAFILLTPDDIGGLADNNGKTQKRVRQNVLFELGYFLGYFGRTGGKVIMLHKGDLELPSDISGLLFIDINDGIKSAADVIRNNIFSVRSGD